METKIIDRYELIACTAIAVNSGYMERQSAILCRDMDACLGDAFCVYFDYSLDYFESPEDLCNAEYPEFDDDTLATPRSSTVWMMMQSERERTIERLSASDPHAARR